MYKVQNTLNSPISNECSSSNPTVPQPSPSRPSVPACRRERSPTQILGRAESTGPRTEWQIEGLFTSIFRWIFWDFHSSKENPINTFKCYSRVQDPGHYLLFVCLARGFKLLFWLLCLFWDRLAALPKLVSNSFLLPPGPRAGITSCTTRLCSPGWAFPSWAHRHWLPLHRC